MVDIGLEFISKAVEAFDVGILLGLKPSTLRAKMRKYGIRRPQTS